MTTKTLANTTLASVLALVLTVSAAQAETTNGTQNAERPGVATGLEANDQPATRDVKKGLIKADNAMRNTADDIKAFLSGNDDPKTPLEPVVIRRDATAEAVLKRDVVDADGKKFASVSDILISENGSPDKVIIADSGVLGLGAKKAAFDYDTVTTRTVDGKTVVSMNKDALDRAPDFSYDRKDSAEAGTEVQAASTASVREILDGHIVDAKGDKVAAIENVAFNGGNTQLIVKFNDTFGMGGNLAAMNLDSLERVDNKGEVNYRLSEAQTAKFKNYKAAVE